MMGGDILAINEICGNFASRGPWSGPPKLKEIEERDDKSVFTPGVRDAETDRGDMQSGLRVLLLS